MKQVSTFYILMYDITHDRTLQKVAKCVEQFGYERINYSVWYGMVCPEKNIEMKIKLKALLKNPLAIGSKIYYIPLTEKMFERMKSFDGKVIKNMEYWLGRKSTEFF